MTNTTYYNLNIVEGTDIVNPLTVDNPNYEKIDETMHNNAVAGVTLATEIANATVHAITRENSDCSVIRFIATSQWKSGDTATVDGVPVTALLPSGETLPDGAYVINANVLCILTGTNLTFYVGGKKVENASDVIYNDTNVEAELNVLNENVVQINGSIEQINSNLKWKLLKSQTTFGSNNVINLPETYNELYICSEKTGAGVYKGGIIIPFDFVSAGNIFYGCGTDHNGYSVKAEWVFNSDSSIYPNQIFINNVDVTNQYTFKVYYR